MKLIRFLGNGKEYADTSFLHLEGIMTDHTLCGDTLDHDEGTLGHHIIIKGEKVTCPACIDIIKCCRRAKI